MKILSIKLNNLNSLRGEHVINFADEPLAGAGLFCITGPTGAGKSTLLDALTLALYGRAARYNSSSPENMMSRHCGECRAEVEFEAEQGRFRSEWHLHRARKKADGKIQSPKRYLYDAQGHLRAETLNEVDRQIELLTGLDYGRFLRSVMLAQGEFSRFLKANADDRAALLESLTGTTIYSDLSTLAHEELNRRTTELDLKQAQLGAITLMSPEARAEREAELQTLEAACARATREFEQATHQLQQTTRLQQLLEQTNVLKQQLASLQDREIALQPDLQRLARHRESEQWSAPLAKLAAAEDARQQTAAALTQAESAATAARRRWQAGLLTRCELAEQFALGKEQALKTATENLASALHKASDLDQWLEAYSPDARLSDKLPELAAQIQQLADHRRSVETIQRQTAALAGEIEQHTKALAHATSLLKDAQGTRDAAEAQRLAAEKSLLTLLAGSSEAELASGLEKLTGRTAGIEQLIHWRKHLEEKEKTLADSTQNLQTLTRSLPLAGEELARAGQALESAKTDLALKQDHLTKAQIVASLDEHRTRLKPGEMCPLCGSLEHPLASGQAPGPGLDTLRQAVQKAEQETARAERERNTANFRLNKLQADEAAARQAVDALTREVTAIRQQIAAQASHHALADTAMAALQQAASECSQAISRSRDQLRRVREARDHAAACTAAVARAGADAATARAQATLEEKQLTKSTADQALEQQRLAARQSELSACAEALAAALQPWLGHVPDPGSEATLLKTLQSRCTIYKEQSAARDKSQALAAQLQTEAVRLTEQLGEARQRAGFLASHRQAQGAISPVLSPTETAEFRRNWKDLEQADTSCTELEKQHEEKRIAATMLANQLAERGQVAAGLAGDLATRLAATAFQTIAGLKSARLDPAEASRIQQLADGLKTGQDQFRGALEQAEKNITHLRAEGAAEPSSIPALEALALEKKTARESGMTRIGAVRHDLEQDSRNRQRAAAQAAALEQEQARLTVWNRLQGLIGSHDGRKFRRFAQGITLDVLVLHANRHLARLTDRYQVRRHAGEELDLEMEDLYQAGVRRPTASLSGGESFLASLALALGLADLAGRNTRIDSLFIDEGFGSLDSDSLDVAISALESLRQDSKMVGVISHVPLLKERIATRIQVEKLAGGSSTVNIARL